MSYLGKKYTQQQYTSDIRELWASSLSPFWFKWEVQCVGTSYASRLFIYFFKSMTSTVETKDLYMGSCRRISSPIGADQNKETVYISICNRFPLFCTNNNDAIFVIVYFFPQRQFKMYVRFMVQTWLKGIHLLYWTPNTLHLPPLQNHSFQPFHNCVSWFPIKCT